uniref:Uncharacterized protein n=1 Tax=Rhipicephalus zambeziensis TaxID=60191 RepID=A0A224YFC7_9ACAR
MCIYGGHPFWLLGMRFLSNYRRLYLRHFCLLPTWFATLLNVPISSAIYAKVRYWVNISRSHYRLPSCICQVKLFKCAVKRWAVAKRLTRNIA